MSEVDVRHRAYEIAENIADGTIKREDYFYSTDLIHETRRCLRYLHSLAADLEADCAGLEVELEGVQVGASKLESENNALNNWQASLEHTVELLEADIEHFKAIADGKDYVPTILLKESEKQLSEASDKIAEQAQELVELRKAANQRHILESELRRANIKLTENDRELEKLRNRILLSPSQDDLAGFAARESGVKAAEQYLKKPSRSYLTGVVLAVGEAVRLVRGGRR